MKMFLIAVALGAIILPLGHARAASLHADFNGDGYADLAIGVDGKDIGANVDAGAVQVIYGSAKGLTNRSNDLFDQDSGGLADTPQTEDEFGHTLAAGDFNADGFADLAVGVPGEEVNGVPAAGAAHVLYGSKKGLLSKRSQFLSQDSPGVADAAETNDYFGNALATGDFDGDGFDDLAIGVPGETIENGISAAGLTKAAGAIHILYGGARGLAAARNTYWRQGLDGIPGAPEAYDHFGVRLATADFDADGYDDLAVSAPHEDDDADPGIIMAGVVHVLRGSVDGITSSGNQLWEQDSPGLAATAKSFASLGVVMSTGDFNADGFGDLAWYLSADVGSALQAGALDVLYGTPAGLQSAGHTYLTEDTPGVQGQATMGASFGADMAAGDLNGDGFDDLAVGAFLKQVSGLDQAGAVHVFSGSPAGLNGQDGQAGFDDQYFDRATPGVDGNPGFHEFFGLSLAAHDFNGDGLADLAVGVAQKWGAGGVQVFYGEPLGLSTLTDYTWTQDSPGVKGKAESADHFGYSLAR